MPQRLCSSRSLLAVLLAACAGVTSACGPPSPEPAVPPAGSIPTPASSPAAKVVSLQDMGVSPVWMDGSADACQDFFELACGGLLKNIEIPPDEASWGPAQELEQKTEQFLRELLEKDTKEPGTDPLKKKLGAWYGACLNEDAIEKAGITPLKDLLDGVEKVKDKPSLYAAVTALHKRAIFPLFGIGSQQDYMDATRVIAGLDQSGLGLPDRDYYLDADARTKDMRDFYKGHVERMFGLAGAKPDEAKKAVEDVMRIETALAKIAQDKVVRRDPHNIYHKIDRKGVADAAKGFPWDAYFKDLGFPDIKDVTVNSVDYLKGFDALMAQEKPEAWRHYLRWMVLSSQANRLGKAFVDERFKFRQKLTGQKENDPRWRRCVRSSDAALGELLGQQYVAVKFDAESKQMAEGLLQSVRAAMKSELGVLPWMDEATRTAAQDKLAKMNDKIGYPVKWRTYDFDVSPTEYAKNVLASSVFELRRELGKVGKPVDRNEWQMTPPMVNAYYDASLNEMVFPAGILQPPFFSKTFHPSVNFGATAAVMGHELTHGFDDEGSQFDGSGNLRNWWTDATEKRFKEQTACVVEQYSRYEALPGIKLNGKLTAGENIADIGGLKLAHAAFRENRKAATEHVTAGKYTEEQVFFLAFAQSWCDKARPELLELIAKTNPHSPPRFRVNGVVADVPAFAEAFSCKEGTPMHPPKICSVW